MNIVLGGNGLLGKTLQERELFQKDWVFIPREECDITIYPQVKTTVERFNPQIIINAAAYTDVTRAETDKRECSNVNHWGVKNICTALSDKPNIKLIHISTNFVFWGDKTKPYNEHDICNPINYYGLSKFMGENVISSVLANYLIIRTSWLFGCQANNFLIKMIDLLSQKDKIVAPTDAISVPTSSTSLAKAIENFIAIDGNGLYHFVSNSKCSSFDYISEINRLAGTNCVIEPVLYSQYLETPLRPKYSALSTEKYEALFNNDEDWKITLQHDINRLISNKLDGIAIE